MAKEEWQPDIEGSINDVKLEVRKLNKNLEWVFIDHAPFDGIIQLPELACAHLSESTPMGQGMGP
jgi:hypothetical protein